MKFFLPANGEFSFEEKRSKFFSFCAPAETEAAAKNFVAEIRAAHPRANHNVFAFCAEKITRASDDGEPSGTAGIPVLNVFVKKNVVDFVCVVTRYFGGTHLGTGGLVRAYTKAAQGALEAASPRELTVYKTHKIICEYTNLDKLKYNLDKNGIEVSEISYTEKCALTV
ncbi:MAG: YigZ family protein, partial [Defluviitaleaceae bacterium]|nr:YigZ family protein [Defluviitaleaceae bacterium]